ncbi:MAG TPA: right-handed parallel beta-helix repeat-containing protein, partial [Anaerolineae bacterium]|nr:right-handed parallel beta-helix repeat-containing protein [Anaerolineae bacterium]
AATLVSNTFSNNGTYGAYLIFHPGCHSDTRLEGNRAVGNGQVNGIYLEGAVTSPAGCRLGYNAAAPYVIWSVNVYEHGLLVLEPGVQTKYVGPTFSRATGALIVTGTLEAVGTAEMPVAFTSFWDDAVGGDSNADGAASPPRPGDWLGLVVRPGGRITLDHGLVRYAGAHGAGLSAIDAALYLANSEFSHSAGKGVQILVDGATRPLTLRNNTFFANSDYAASVRTAGSAVAAFEAENNGGSGNGVNGLLLDAALGTMTLKHNPSLPYVVQSVTVASNQTVTVNSAVVLKGDQVHSGGGSLFAVDGVLRVMGTSGGEVYLTSLHDDIVGGDTLGNGGAIQPAAGDWRGLNINSGGQAHLAHTVLRYAGSDDTGLYNLAGLVTMDRCRIIDNVGSGISNQEGADLIVTNSLIARNSGSGVGNSADSTASITYCDIKGNGEYGVRSSAPPGSYLVAEDNFWGAASGPGWDGGYCEYPPSGSGDLITCHNVDYIPFATTAYY